ncbi:MAG TPA: hypothetical protein VN457_07635 [Chlamydiales bacterium]|nr:hypothetical protein [Chlamydiales bacterium]
MHLTAVLIKHQALLVESARKLTDDELANSIYVRRRNAFLTAVVDKLKNPVAGRSAPKMATKLSVTKETTAFALPACKAVDKPSAAYQSARKLIDEWFKLFSNPAEIFHTFDREDLKSMRLNGKPLTQVVKTIKDLEKTCDDATFLKLAKIAHLAQVVAESFTSGTDKAKKANAAELLGLCPIESNPISDLPKTFLSLVPHLYRNDETNTPIMTNTAADKQSKVRFEFITKKKCALQANQNFVVIQGEDRTQLAAFSQFSSLSKPGKGTIYRGYSILK